MTIVQRFDVSGTSKLIVPIQAGSTGDNSGIRYYVTTEEVFDIMYEVHVRVTGHEQVVQKYNASSRYHFFAAMRNVPTTKKWLP